MMLRIGWSVVAALAAGLAVAEPEPPAPPAFPRVPPKRVPVVVGDAAMALHRSCLVVDGHNDLPWELRQNAESSFRKLDIAKPQPTLHTDIPRLRQGGLGAQFWSAYVPSDTAGKGVSARWTFEQIDLIHRMAERYPDDFRLVGTADEIEAARRDGKIAGMIGVEGGHSIENSLGVLRSFYRLGVRYMTLTHGDTIDWADAATDKPRHGGLTPFGEDVVREMNRLGMLVDISHVSVETMRDTLRVSRAPVIASHSSAFAVANHPRNVPDEILKQLAERDGVVMVNFFSGFVLPEGARAVQDMFRVGRELRVKFPKDEDFAAAFRAWRKEHPFPKGTIHNVLDHIDHIARVAGPERVGLGSDYDGITSLPEQLEDVASYPRLTQGLLDRGYTEAEVRGILGGNLMRVLRKAEAAAEKPGR